MVNGYSALPILAGAAAGPGEPPVVGLARARITRPLLLDPAYSGRYGRAWRCSLGARDDPANAAVALLLVEAPWSHQVVHSILIGAVHLRYLPGRPRPTTFLEGATHEIHVFGIHPAADRAHLVQSGIDPTMLLKPMVFAAQIIAPSDEDAAARVQRAAELVCGGQLGTRPEHMRQWAEVFGDEVLRNAIAPPEDGEEGEKLS